MARLVRVGCVIAMLATMLAVGAASPAAARGRCADYAYQEDAQADLAVYPSLDGDKDGVACESLPHRSSATPSRSATITVIGGQCASDPTASITRLYLAYFERQPDPSGLAFWVDRCDRDVSTLVGISDAFADSAEFVARYGTLGNAAFVTLVYRNVLGRAPDPNGLQSWLDFIARGAPRGEVMLGFSESPEFVAKTGGDIESLTVAPSSSLATYSRSAFGDDWIDADHDGCNTREEVLIRQSLDPAVVSHIGGCAVASGRWLDPYTATTYTSPGELDIDHVVPLANAWVSGASTWTSDQRLAFANDLDSPELLAVSFVANRSKGDRSPDEWKPPNQGEWCAYARAWVAVKATWHLTITAPEKSALVSMLLTCPA